MQQMASDPTFLASVDAAVQNQRKWESFASSALAHLRRRWANLARTLEAIDWEKAAQLLAEYHEQMPANVRGRLAIHAALRDPENMPVPLAWVVPSEVVVEILYDCATPDEMVACALRHQDAILDYCEEAMAEVDLFAATVAQEAIAALRDGHEGAAQSHAANLVDSVILAVIPAEGKEKPRQVAIRRGSSTAEDVEEFYVRAVAERIVLGPLRLAFARWHPGSDEPIPSGFARHATAHAAHMPEVFSPSNALVGVMLACSLVRHYRSALA